MPDFIFGLLLQKSFVILSVLLSQLLPQTDVIPNQQTIAQQNQIVISTSTKQAIKKVSQVVLGTTTTQRLEKEVNQATESDTATKTPAVIFSDDISYPITSVVDGDTIKVRIDGKADTIRIIGINTPEVVDPRRPVQCFGKEASDKGKELLVGKEVILESDPSQGDKDKYGRLLRYVFVDGVDYGDEMIKTGYAYEYTYHLPYKYQKKYKESESYAKGNNLGLWAPATCNGVLK